MALACKSQGRRQALQHPRPPPVFHDHAVLLLLLPLLLPLLRPMGCLGADGTPRLLSAAAPTSPGLSSAHSATCPSGQVRILQPGVNLHSVWDAGLVTAPAEEIDLIPTCGLSYELDVTLTHPEALARRWPWMVSVRINGVHSCAGTIIAHQWVLTIAHCLTRKDAIYSVRAGSPWVNQTAKTSLDILVEQVIVNRRYQYHRYWSWVGSDQDLGLLKLQQNLSYSKYIWPICLPDPHYVLKDKSHCIVTGWGLPNASGLLPQFHTLQEKDVTILDRKKCDSFYHKFSKVPSLIRIITPRMICVEDSDREKFCYERSGEPLVCSVQGTWVLVGVMSWGPGCNESTAPPIFLQTMAYRHWIWDVLSGQPLATRAGVLLLFLLLPVSLLATH